MWQEATGTTAAVVGQPVGRLLDKKSGLVRGANLVPAFAGWTGTNGGVVSVVNGRLRLTNGSAAAGRATINFPVVVGSTYEITGTKFNGTSSGSVNLRSGQAETQTQYLTSSGAGDTRAIFEAGTTTEYVTVISGDAVIGNYVEIESMAVCAIPGNHGAQATSASRPTLLSPPAKLDYDGVDDSLGITFPVSLGAACTVARAVPGVGASILTAQTIGTSYTDSTDHCGLVIINRALTGTETASLTRYLNAKAGV
jgi:hypothetical protein